MTEAARGDLKQHERIEGPMTRTRRQYDSTFKREAVQDWLASGKTAEVVARELGIDPGCLFTWRRPAKARTLGLEFRIKPIHSPHRSAMVERGWPEAG